MPVKPDKPAISKEWHMAKPRYHVLPNHRGIGGVMMTWAVHDRHDHDNIVSEYDTRSGARKRATELNALADIEVAAAGEA